MKTIFDIAKAEGRDYVTPEDISDSIKSGCPKETLQSDVLKLLGRQAGFGAEDSSLCAFIAWRFEEESTENA